MSIHLVGGGRPSTHDGVVYGPFVSEAATHAAGRGVQRPRIGLVAVADDDEELQEQVTRFTAVLTGRGECDVVAFPLRPGDRLELTSLASLDGLLVAGGLTPAYHQALMPASDDIAGLVARGVPYLGFSAGAAIAADHALLGGWRVGEVAVCSEDNAEDLDQLSLQPGLGLVRSTVDVHAAQWGNVSRLIMAIRDTDGVDQGMAIDEHTVLIIDGTTSAVRGAGQVWRVRRSGHGFADRELTVAPIAAGHRLSL
jgi:cyanophycinase